MGPLDEVFAGLGNVYQVTVLAVGDGGDDKTLVQSNGDADVNVRAGDQMVVLEIGVEIGVLFDGPGTGLDNQVADADSHSLGKGVVKVPPKVYSLAHVYLAGDIEMGSLPHAPGGAAGDDLAHPAKGQPLPIRRSVRRHRWNRGFGRPSTVGA